MIGTVLRVVFDHEDERRSRCFTVGDGLDDLADGIVVVGHFRLDGVHPVDRGVEITKMVMAQSQQGERGHRSLELLIGIFPLPFENAPIVGQTLIEPAKIGVAATGEKTIAGSVNAGMRLPRLARGNHVSRLARIVDRGIGEAIVANTKTFPDRRIPQEALTVVVVVIGVRGGQQGWPGHQIGIGRQRGIGGMAFGRGLLGIDEPIGLFCFIAKPAGRIVYGCGLFEQVGDPARGGPRPAGAGLLAGIVEIVERHELPGEGVVVGR